MGGGDILKLLEENPLEKYPISYLAEVTGVNIHSARKCVNSLAKGGLIGVEERREGSGRATKYISYKD